MKKLLLAAAALIVMSASAHAKSAHVRLPDMLVGNWCLNGNNPGASPQIYAHGHVGDECDNILDVKHDSYETNEYGCQIKTARRITYSAFVVHTHCGETEDNQWDADTLFQAIDNYLYVSECQHNRCPNFQAHARVEAPKMSQRDQRTIGPDICRGHLWIHHLASIQSTSDSSDDAMSCSFDPATAIGKRVLRVCNEFGGSAEHGCWIKGTFVVDANGDRRLTGVVEVRKLDGPGNR